MEVKKSRESLISGFGKAGWGIIVYCAAMFWLYVGMVNDGTNITAPAVAEKLGIESGTVVSMGTISGIVGILFFIAIGQINRRLGARLTSGICMIMAGVAYIGIGLSTSIIMYTVCLCFVTGGAMSAGYIAGGSLVAEWFPKKKGIVMGYTTMGHNLASAFYVPMISGLVSCYGVTRGVVLPAILSICLGIVGIIYIRNTPQERGQNPDNVTDEVYEREYFTEKLDSDGGWTTKKLLKTKETWLAAISTGLFQVVTVGVMSQLVIRNQQLGFSQTKAITIMTVVACIGVFGSWIVGIIDQKWGTKKGMIIFALWYMIALIFNISEIKSLVYVSIIMIGMAIGGSANFTTSFPTAIFGRHGFSKVNSVVFPIQGFITSMCFFINGLALNIGGNLRSAYIIYVIILLVNTLIIYFTDEHKYNRDYTTLASNVK
ncbi:Transporter, major facilitator family protein [[Clostridium] ultunense Esp]|nr:Transporter, major facilitator family protein [[Clostridium] ultunense Esp]